MARNFNGTTARLNVNGAQLYNGLTTAYSLAFWVKAASQNGPIAYSEAHNTTSNFFGIQTATGGLLRVAANNGSATILNFTTVSAILNSTWRHFTYTQTTGRLSTAYVDGVSDATSTPGAASWVTTNNARIGDIDRSGVEQLFWAGSLCHLASWSRTLTAGEARLLASGLPPSHLAPDHYWPLWGVDSPEPDLGSATHVTGAVTAATAVAEARVTSNLLRITA